ncbi:MAG TPA: M1 family metallopeptidase [Candidatus Desulfaltia sp.]|nr:M1 family metallopeptidase [Candidatus Desulfaltia sp.]
MKKIGIFLLSSLGLINPSIFGAMSKHIVDYRIQVKLQPETKGLAGRETVTWLNDSLVPVSELQFHLYLNAFKNNRSTFMKESGGAHRGFKVDENDWGYITVKNVRIRDGEDLTSRMEFIQPDDGNPDDQTVMRIPLAAPVGPQERIALEIEFEAKLPRVFARSGFADDFYMAGQWFPKLGVNQDGVWNCHQYHESSEFFADYGVFEVEITVPKGYVVGATGQRTSERDNGDGTASYTHYQEDVHDFAWTACPDFVEFRERFYLEDLPVDTEIILLVHRQHLNQKPRFLDSLKKGLEFYSRNYGPYPYQTVTLVDPPIKAMGAGGMEYPTLFTTMAVWFMPKGLRMPEMVTIHEFGHGYWYGIVGSNEFEEAWLDEGINSYSEMKAMDRYYGHDRSMVDLGPLKISDGDYHRLQFIPIFAWDPIVKNSWEFVSGGSYGSNVYSKAALTLKTLENHLGEEVMARIMRTYYERWKFRHPTTGDFIAVAEEVSGRDLGWFFDQFLKTAGSLDYAVSGIRSREEEEPAGFYGEEFLAPKPDKSGRDKDQDKVYRNEVVVQRKGELFFPQEILVTFEDGEEIREIWDGRDRWRRFIYRRPVKLKSARLDPENKILLDVNFFNNSKVLKPDRASPLKYALGLALKFQEFLTWLSF